MRATLLLLAAFIAAAPVEPLGRWDGMLPDAALKSLAPKGGFLTDQKSFAELWKAWRPAEPAPTVDFDKELILVAVVTGPNRVILRPSLDETGDLKFLVAGTKKGGPGFGYCLMRVSREGVNRVNGQSLLGPGVHGVLQIEDKTPTFADQALEIQLWEFDPRIADAAATKVDEFRLEKYAHTQGKPTETPFTVGGKLTPNPERRYYMTIFVVKDGQRTHMGGLPEKEGPVYVLGDGKPTQFTLTLRSLTKE